MAVIFVIDGKQGKKMRLPFIPSIGETVEIRHPNQQNTDVYKVVEVKYRVDLRSPTGITDTFVSIKHTGEIQDGSSDEQETDDSDWRSKLGMKKDE